MGNLFGVIAQFCLVQLGVQFAQFAFLFEGCRFAVVAPELCQFGLEAVGGVPRLLCKVGQFLPGRINGTVQIVEGGAVQLRDAGSGGMGCLGNVLH